MAINDIGGSYWVTCHSGRCDVVHNWRASDALGAVPDILLRSGE
jgi:hypothetical protein